MLRGKLSNAPCPTIWVDWRAVVPDLGTAMKLMMALTEDTLLFDRVVRKIQIDKSVLHWFTRNHAYAFDVFVVGEQMGAMDRVLEKKLNREWVQHIYYAPDIHTVVEEMKERTWVLGYLTPDRMLVNEGSNVYLFTGPGMKLSDLGFSPEGRNA